MMADARTAKRWRGGGVPLRRLDPDKAAQLTALFALLADAHVAALAPALKATAGRTGVGRHAIDLLLNEQEDRRLRDIVFAPLVPLTRRRAGGTAPPLPLDAPALLWRTLRRAAGEAVDATLRAVSNLTEPDLARRACDALASQAGAHLRAPGEAGDEAAPAWTALRDALDARSDGGADALAAYLALTPLARACTPRLRNWIRTASPEHAAGLRLAYRDAGTFGEDAPPRLLEMLSAQLDHDWQMLRLLSAVMDRPRDSFLAVSELGRFAEAVLDDVDDRVQTVRAFDAAGGASAGKAAAAAVCAAVMALSEFDRSIDIRPDGPWAKRIAAQRRNLSRGVETRIKQADGALARALPVAGSGLGPVRRGAPRLDTPVDEMLTAKAAALVAFVAEVRSGADYGGFAGVRAKAVEALDQRLSNYADDLVQAAHEGEGAAADEARSRLGFVAECLGRLRDSKAAEVVRRRAAAA